MRSKTIYFLGIGGIGMSALAQYFLQRGDTVCGYDLTPSAVTDMLIRKGADIHFEGDISKIPEKVDFVVVTPAVPKDFVEYQYFAGKDIPMFKRSQVLGHITDELRTLAVAGTHGKTTTTSMISHLLYPEQPLAAFIGGISKNLNDNYICSPDPDIAVVEADEFDRSFLTLHPEVSVITSMDADHLDIYCDVEDLRGAFRQFAAQTSRTVLVHEAVAQYITQPNKKTYGTGENCDYRAYHIEYQQEVSLFDLHTPHGELTGLRLPAHGIYNICNATAAIAAVLEAFPATPAELIHQKISTFAGVKRRFDYIVRRDDFVYIDDYAHHPNEMRSFITAVRDIYQGKKICGVFQPHLYTRTRDFADDFAAVLDLLDQAILLPIYPAREKPIEGITSEFLLQKMNNPNKLLLQKTELLSYLQSHKPDVLLTIGAGDIDRLVPVLAASL
ncbi:MAG: UDP-N-acetylmuramate--L-alanine ligase [Bacteroidales bacterium]|nr:UDP-N-acetylmuramate--L-alanine ligase [Bacteroidales bacterium]